MNRQDRGIQHLNDLEEIRKNQIILATLKKISEVGSDNVTMDDIAREAGLSKGGVAHYFPSKDVLCREAFKRFFERIFQRSRDTIIGFADPLSKLLSFGWLYNWNDPDVNLGYPLLFDAMAMASHDAAYRQLFHEWVDRWIEMLSEAIREGREYGLFQDADPVETARTISAIYHGVAVRWYLDRDSHSSDWALRAVRNSITRLMGVKG
ncbi:MAG: TetR/AcrR family transcriptional regulator [Spirochaetes bacterium]|nr:TetR/AcrR family transcriptional regulator [Spirochaetota bacterium]